MDDCRVNIHIAFMEGYDLQELGSVYWVNVPNTKTKITEKFTISENIFEIIEEYISCRPTHVTNDMIFLN